MTINLNYIAPFILPFIILFMVRLLAFFGGVAFDQAGFGFAIFCILISEVFLITGFSCEQINLGKITFGKKD